MRPSIFRRGKKGTVLDAVALIIIVLSLTVGLIFAAVLFTGIKNGINTGGFNTTVSEKAFTQVDRSFTTFDSAVILIFVVANLAAMYFAFQVKTTPGLIFIGLLLVMFNILLAVIANNVYDAIASSSNSLIQAEMYRFPKSQFIMNKLPVFIIIADLLIMLGLYSSSRD